MGDSPLEIIRSGISRRDFLFLSTLSAAGVAAGCATNPVTGQSQLMLMSESQEIQIDRKYSPQQYSVDYGQVQDKALNAYVNGVGQDVAKNTHRADMSYTVNTVNAVYVNAYAFPGGSIGVTRGILLKMENEGELAALLGHELGHVNARHTAQQMTKGTLAQAILGGLTVYASTHGRVYGQLANTLGMIGAGALLASYSRGNEREADALGMQYMVKSGYGPRGFVGLMEMLNEMHKKKEAGAFELLFATHPMSDERYNTALAMADNYKEFKSRPVHKERYLDNTARLRKIKGPIEQMQKSEKQMAEKRYEEAEKHLNKALKGVPEDYAGLVMMGKCQAAQKKYKSAERYAEKAKSVYPQEAQGYHLSGFAKIKRKKYESALENFESYERMMPGNPNTTFFKGLALDGMGRIEPAANEYYQYLKVVQEGEKAKHAYSRLKKWGYIK